MNDDTLEVELILNDQKFRGRLRNVKKDLDDFDNTLKKTKRGLAEADSGFSRFMSGFSAGIGVIKAFAGGMIAGSVALGGFAFKSVQAAADLEALALSVENLEGNSRAATARLAQLRQAARAPGLGYSEAIQGYVGLRNARLDGSFSVDLLQNVANANARAGGGRDRFERILLQISQIANRPFLMGEELTVLEENGLSLRPALRDRFGTADPEELRRLGIDSQQVLRGINQELAKLPRVGGGARNTLDNVADSLNQLMAGVGFGLLGTGGAALAAAPDAMDQLNAAGVDKLLGETLGQQFLAIFGIAETGADGFASAMIDAGAAAVGFGAALRNATLNITAIANAIGGFDPTRGFGVAGEVMREIRRRSGRGPKTISEAVAGTDGLDLSPMAEAQRFRDEAELKRELDRKERDKRKKQLDEDIKNLDAQEGRGGSAAGPSVVPILTRIEENTRPLREIADQILGGGGFANQSFNARNASAWGRGGGGGQGERFLRAIIVDELATQLRLGPQ